MATRGPLGRGKRERERARAEKQKQKIVRREETKQRRGDTSPKQPGIDPDIAGIVPGPQPNPWLDDLEDEPAEETEENNKGRGRPPCLLILVRRSRTTGLMLIRLHSKIHVGSPLGDYFTCIRQLRNPPSVVAPRHPAESLS